MYSNSHGFLPFSSQVSQISALCGSRCLFVYQWVALSTSCHHRPSVSLATGRPDLSHALQLHLHPGAPVSSVCPWSSSGREERGRGGWRWGGWHPAGDHPPGVHQSQLSPVHAELAHQQAEASGTTTKRQKLWSWSNVVSLWPIQDHGVSSLPPRNFLISNRRQFYRSTRNHHLKPDNKDITQRKLWM